MAVTWVAGTSLAHNLASTTISASTPAGIANGDKLIAGVFARYVPLTPPAGWTQVIQTPQFFEVGGEWFRIIVFSKDSVTTADASTSFTWTQATVTGTTRMGVVYAVLRGVGSLVASAQTTLVEVNTWSIAPPTLTASADGQMLLMFGSTVLQSGTQTPTAPAGATLFTGGAASADQRLAGAYQARDNGQSNSGSFNLAPTGGATSNGLGAVTLRFSSAPSNGANVALPRLATTGGNFPKGNAAIRLPRLFAPEKPAAPSFWTRRERARELA